MNPFSSCHWHSASKFETCNINNINNYIVLVRAAILFEQQHKVIFGAPFNDKYVNYRFAGIELPCSRVLNVSESASASSFYDTVSEFLIIIGTSMIPGDSYQNGHNKS